MMSMIMVILGIAAILGTGGWAALIVVPYLAYMFRDSLRAEALKFVDEDDMEDPLARIIVGDMTYKDHLHNERYQKRLAEWT